MGQNQAFGDFTTWGGQEAPTRRGEDEPLKSCCAAQGKSTKEIMRCLKRYVAREIYDQLLHPSPAPDTGTLRTTRTAKRLTLQQAADALHAWPTTLSQLERGLSHDNDLHKRYETWLNGQSPATVQPPHRLPARALPA